MQIVSLITITDDAAHDNSYQLDKFERQKQIVCHSLTNEPIV